MTAITPAGANAEARPRHAVPARGGRDFAGLLDARSAAGSAASSFEGRGMFGAHGAIELPGAAAHSALAAAAVIAGSAAAAAGRDAASEAGGNTVTAPAARSPAVERGNIAPPAALSNRGGAAGEDVAEPASADRPRGASLEAGPAAEAAPIRATPRSPRMPARPAPPEAMLTVAGADDALHVVARGGGLDGGTRRRAQAIAAEFGMEIAEFRLDGAPADRPEALARGGGNGHRTR